MARLGPRTCVRLAASALARLRLFAFAAPDFAGLERA